MDRMQPTRIEPIHLNIETTPGFSTAVGISMSSLECFLDFLHVTPAPVNPEGQEVGPAIVHHLAKVGLTIPHLKQMTELLKSKLEEYETMYGRIETPKACGLLVPNRNIVSPL